MAVISFTPEKIHCRYGLQQQLHKVNYPQRNEDLRFDMYEIQNLRSYNYVFSLMRYFF